MNFHVFFSLSLIFPLFSCLWQNDHHGSNTAQQQQYYSHPQPDAQQQTLNQQQAYPYDAPSEGVNGSSGAGGGGGGSGGGGGGGIGIGIGGDGTLGEALSSLPQASFNYINSIVGSGVIGIPYAFHRAGFGLGLLLLILVAYITDYSLILMVSIGI